MIKFYNVNTWKIFDMLKGVQLQHSEGLDLDRGGVSMLHRLTGSCDFSYRGQTRRNLIK